MRRPRSRTARAAAVAGLTAAALCAPPASASASTATPSQARAGRVASLGPAASPSGAACRGYRFPVRPQAGKGAVHHVYGELCVRGRLTAATPVQVLLHGGTYDHAYWDWPYRPRTYSYVAHATRAGFATLNLDRLGYGRSDRPDPERLDFAAAGRVVHQVVRYLRAGALGPRFETVVLNGHSMGGITAEHAAAHGEVNAVIVSGIAPDAADETGEGPDEDGPGGPGGDPYHPFHPAGQDAKFAGKRWAAGYLTTRPGTRAGIFLYPGTYEPAVARYEEALKDTLAVAELRAVRGGSGARPAEAPVLGDAPPRVPVLYALGRHDLIACGRTRDCATTPGAREAGYLVPRSGHSINVSKGAPLFYRMTFRWLAEHGVS